MLWVYDQGYDYGRGLPLPRQIHGFARDKPSRILKELARLGVTVSPTRPTAVTEAMVRSVHTDAVVKGLSHSRTIAQIIELAPLALLPVGLLRHMVVAPQFLAAGGTRLALEHAVQGGWAINLSGGFHHARPDLVHGFCLINDVAIAVQALEAKGSDAPLPKIAVLDLDLHQGDGNAAAFQHHPNVFTASVHQASAFPHPKLQSDLDVGLPDGIEDRAYLAAVGELCDRVSAALTPDVIVYVAGTDPFEEDTQGSLRVSFAGMVARDRQVAEWARTLKAGLLVLPAGGYSEASPRVAAAGYKEIAGLEP